MLRRIDFPPRESDNRKLFALGVKDDHPFDIKYREIKCKDISLFFIFKWRVTVKMEIAKIRNKKVKKNLTIFFSETIFTLVYNFFFFNSESRYRNVN